MRYIKSIFVTFVCLALIVVSGCAKEEENTVSATVAKEQTGSAQEQQDILYQNESIGLSVYETTGWQLNEEKQSKGLNVTFSNNKMKAIITAVNTDKSFEEIKSEFKRSSANSEVLEEKDSQLSFKSNTSKVRTDIFLERVNDQTYIYTFLTPIKSYSESKSVLSAFINNIEIK